MISRCSPGRTLVINGDDFGVSHSVNQAIVQAHTQGILTSASLMVTGAAAEEAIALAKTHPTLAVGLHLVLACGRSVLPHSQIPNLVDEAGNFSFDANTTGLRYQFDRAAQAQIKQEIRAQLEKFLQTGIPLSHVDGHVHIHVHPVVFPCLVELAEEFNIRFVRLPGEELGTALKIDHRNGLMKLLWWSVFSGLSLNAKRYLRSRSIQFNDRVFGVLQSGSMTEEYLLKLIPEIQSHCVEVYFHPDIDSAENPSAELAALLSDRVRQALKSAGFDLTNFHALSNLYDQC